MRSGGRLLLLWVWVFAQGEGDSLPQYETAPVEIRAQRHALPASFEGLGERLAKGGLVGLVYRSVPFAQEVVYQGLLPQQTQVTIDGMRVLPACVDRMDPVLTFVEQAAFVGATWSPGQSWGATPTLDVSLLVPGLAAERYLTIQVADNYHRFIGAFRLGGGKGRWRYAAALTTRSGASYRSGRFSSFSSSEVFPLWGRDSTWSIPPFKKYNLYAALLYEPAEGHEIEVRYLGDFFYDVAYPALIMDSRHSAFHLPHIHYSWRDRFRLRVYANTIFHDMTDERRPEGQIRTRLIMPGMYMPMKGLTRSTGAIVELTYPDARGWKIIQRSDYSYHSAHANMDMYLLGGGSVMNLLNLADIRFHQMTHYLAFERRYAKGEQSFYLNGSFFSYWVGDTVGFAPLRLYQERYAGASSAARRFVTYQAGWRSLYRFTPQTRLTATLSYGTRPPTHVELYAYYLYVPMDNSIQMGNSTLRSERLLHAEAQLAYQGGAWLVEMNGFFNFLQDYITPVTFLLPFSPGNGTAQFWRILQNTGRAYTAGGSLQAAYEVGPVLLRLQTGYTYGWHLDYREPLPWIYPLYGRLQTGLVRGRHRLMTEVYAAASQKHLSRTIYPEDRTRGYWLLNARYSYTLPLSTLRSRGHLTFAVVADNLLNAYGWDHLSVGNMPFLGRVVGGGLWYTW